MNYKRTGDLYVMPATETTVKQVKTQKWGKDCGKWSLVGGSKSLRIHIWRVGPLPLSSFCILTTTKQAAPLHMPSSRDAVPSYSLTDQEPNSRALCLLRDRAKSKSFLFQPVSLRVLSWLRKSQGRKVLSSLHMQSTAQTQKIWNLNKRNGCRVERQTTERENPLKRMWARTWDTESTQLTNMHSYGLSVQVLKNLKHSDWAYGLSVQVLKGLEHSWLAPKPIASTVLLTWIYYVPQISTCE